ncbi:hypothetical protein IWW39_006190 [Coemansia spiralis]|uniref:Uncharacterized protein n=1 Tax=Coemansia spiralis TaxID=417178 RepID=A0A9W8L130_9FUNG|nr:hypothetical protein IWW39_006190 [Coemansia spiralis]
MNTALVLESGAYLSDALVPATSANAAPVPAHGTDAGAAIFLAPDASANATLAPVPSVGPSNSLAPATSISINDVIDSITLLGLSGGTAASTALAGASAADSAPAIGTSMTVYVRESDGIHEYEKMLEASETGLVNRTALLARPQPAKDPEIGEASEMASGPSLVTDAGTAIVSAHGTDAGTTLALAPTFGPSGGPIPPIATSVNDINNMVSLLRLDGGAVGELSINQISELANGLSLRTAARKEPDSARHSRWSPGSGSTTRSESTEESLSHAVDARQINALRMFLAAPTLSNLGPSRLRHPRPSVPIEMHIQLPSPRPLRRQPWTQTLAPGRGLLVARSAEDSPGRNATASYPSSLATPDAAARSRAV